MSDKHDPSMQHPDRIRRRIATAFGLAAFAPAVFPAIAPTPTQSRGPFYPQQIPLDADNDLIMVEGHPRPARGEVVHISGRVRDIDGTPLAGARVEIWQCDAFGRYHHAGDRHQAEMDPGFQGFGHTLTGADGGYRFRTIHPVPYPGRAPHIHFAVRWRGAEVLVTQMYVADAAGNRHDFLLMRIRDPQQRARLIVDLQPSAAFNGQKHGRFDLLIG